MEPAQGSRTHFAQGLRGRLPFVQVILPVLTSRPIANAIHVHPHSACLSLRSLTADVHLVVRQADTLPLAVAIDLGPQVRDTWACCGRRSLSRRKLHITSQSILTRKQSKIFGCRALQPASHDFIQIRLYQAHTKGFQSTHLERRYNLYLAEGVVACGMHRKRGTWPCALLMSSRAHPVPAPAPAPAPSSGKTPRRRWAAWFRGCKLIQARHQHAGQVCQSCTGKWKAPSQPGKLRAEPPPVVAREYEYVRVEAFLDPTIKDKDRSLLPPLHRGSIVASTRHPPCSSALGSVHPPSLRS